VDREGLTPEEYERINVHWEDEALRLRSFHALMHSSLRDALPDMPNVLLPLMLEYLSPPALPPSLLALLDAQRRIAEQLTGLLQQQQSLQPTLAQAAQSAEEYLAFRLSARAGLRLRAQEAEAKAKQKAQEDQQP
jgi:hypothetical protein